MHYSWLIQDLMPEREIHLLGGPSGAGKTRWLISTLLEWQAGKPVFGRASNPVPWLYLITDRSQRDFQYTLESMNVNPNSFPFFAADRISQMKDAGYDANCLDDLLRYTQEHYNIPPQLVVVENLGRFCPDINAQKLVSHFLTNLRDKWCNLNTLTILGVREYTKMLPKNRYSDPLDRMSGASTWRNHSHLNLMLEPDLDSGKRILTVAGRYLPRFEVWYEFDSSGTLVPSQGPEAELETDALTSFLLKQGQNDFSAHDFQAHAVACGLSRASTYRLLREAIEEGKLVKVKHGLYHC